MKGMKGLGKGIKVKGAKRARGDDADQSADSVDASVLATSAPARATAAPTTTTATTKARVDKPYPVVAHTRLTGAVSAFDVVRKVVEDERRAVRKTFGPSDPLTVLLSTCFDSVLQHAHVECSSAPLPRADKDGLVRVPNPKNEALRREESVVATKIGKFRAERDAWAEVARMLTQPQAARRGRRSSVSRPSRGGGAEEDVEEEDVLLQPEEHLLLAGAPSDVRRALAKGAALAAKKGLTTEDQLVVAEEERVTGAEAQALAEAAAAKIVALRNRLQQVRTIAADAEVGRRRAVQALHKLAFQGYQPTAVHGTADEPDLPAEKRTRHAAPAGPSQPTPRRTIRAVAVGGTVRPEDLDEA